MTNHIDNYFFFWGYEHSNTYFAISNTLATHLVNAKAIEYYYDDNGFEYTRKIVRTHQDRNFILYNFNDGIIKDTSVMYDGKINLDILAKRCLNYLFSKDFTIFFYFNSPISSKYDSITLTDNTDIYSIVQLTELYHSMKLGDKSFYDRFLKVLSKRTKLDEEVFNIYVDDFVNNGSFESFLELLKGFRK